MSHVTHIHDERVSHCSCTHTHNISIRTYHRIMSNTPCTHTHPQTNPRLHTHPMRICNALQHIVLRTWMRHDTMSLQQSATHCNTLYLPHECVMTACNLWACHAIMLLRNNLQLNVHGTWHIKKKNIPQWKRPTFLIKKTISHKKRHLFRNEKNSVSYRSNIHIKRTENLYLPAGLRNLNNREATHLKKETYIFQSEGPKRTHISYKSNQYIKQRENTLILISDFPY